MTGRQNEPHTSYYRHSGIRKEAAGIYFKIAGSEFFDGRKNGCCIVPEGQTVFFSGYGYSGDVMEDPVLSFAVKYHLDESDVRKYAQSMEIKNLGGASYAFLEIKRNIRLANSDLSLGGFVKVFSPVKAELYERFGDVDSLREEHVQREMEHRNMMEAASECMEEKAGAERKRLEEFEQMTDEGMDVAYFKAMEANNEARMRDIVNEAARRNGYVSADEFRVAHRAPSYDEEGIDKSMFDVAANKDRIRESLNEQLRMNRDKCRDESAAAINRTLSAIDREKEPTVTIYRAVPKSLNEGKVRNGDWVSLSESYVKQHGEYALNGEYRIMKENVPARNLYWDGNDINEWGYDDRSDYRYKDTGNNRKLNDLMTHDGKGNIIPPSRRFNPRKEDIRFRFIGEKGASNLDMAEEGTARLDNLSVAREMEDAGKEPLSIKMATGWERGADGKWRYEVEDFEIDSKGLARRNRLWSNLPWGKEYDALSDKLFDGVELTEEESARFDDLSERAEELRDTYEANEVRYLDDYVKDEKLFKTYPELKQIRVEIYNAPTSNTGATYYGSQNLIRVNESVLDRADFRSILAHDVQHAVQSIEGFARGGNSVTYRSHLDALKEKRDAWFIIEEFANKRKELEEDASQMDVYDALVNEYHSDGFEFGDGFIPSRNAFDNGFNLWVRGYDKEGYEDAYNEYQSLIGKFGLGGENNRYNELSGEVEARNVQSRMNMTPEERRNTLASETEDVAREDQIILDVAKERTELAGYASSLAEKQGIPVSVINSHADIPSDGIRRLVDKKADIRGWYDISSERVCLYLPNAAGKADIQRTLLHEGVAHYGLRRLVGNENMDVFLDNVYAAASGKIRRNIRETALSQKMDIREATEEYLARLAEKDITPGFREKIKQFLTEILRALGFNIDIRDSELNYILAGSKGNLQCPGTKKLPGFSEVRKNTLLITNKSFATGMTGTPMKITDYIRGLIQLNRVKENPSLIINFENPSERMQLAAVSADPELLMNIDNPTEKVQLLAVSRDPSLFLQIRQPSEKACLLAVSNDPELIQYIREPSDKVQLAAVRQSSNVISHVENPCEKAQLAAVMDSPGLIGRIRNPAERVQLAAVRALPSSISDIENPTERVQLLACNTDFSLIGTVKAPSEKVCMYLVSRDPRVIRHIKTPSEKVQFLAVRDNPANILKIDSPSRNVCLSCLTAVLPAEGAAGRFKENISEAVKSLFTQLGEIGDVYEDLMRKAESMNTHKGGLEATEKAEAYRTRETSKAVQAFRKEAVADFSPAPSKSAAAEKKPATTEQASGEELRFKGGRRELTVKDGKATLTVNGRDFDATRILTDMKAQGVDISRVPAKAMGEMLKGNKTALPGASTKSRFSITKGAAGYGLMAFQAVQQANGMAAQEM